MKTSFSDVCDKESSSEYFETFQSLLGAKLIEIEQFKTTSGKKKLEKNTIKVMKVLHLNSCKPGMYGKCRKEE